MALPVTLLAYDLATVVEAVFIELWGIRHPVREVRCGGQLPLLSLGFGPDAGYSQVFQNLWVRGLQE